MKFATHHLKPLPQPQEVRLRPGRPDERQANGQALDLAHGQGQVRVARHRGQGGAGRAVGVAVFQVDEPGGTGGGRDEGGDVVLGQQTVDALMKLELAAGVDVEIKL